MIPGTIPAGNFVNTFSTRTVSYLGTDYIDGEEDSSFTFTGNSLGTAAADRWIIVGIHVLNNEDPNYDSTTTITSCTVNGYIAPIARQASYQTGGGDSGICGIAVAYCPVGSTGDVVVTTNNDSDSMGISLWEANGLKAFAPYDSDVDSAGALSLTLDTLADGFIIGIAMAEGTSSPSTWTNATERYDNADVAATGLDTATHKWTGADTTTAGSPITVSTSAASGSDSAMMLACSF